MEVIDYPAMAWRGRLGEKVRYIIVHSTASPLGDPWNTLRYLRKNDRGVSVHELALPGHVYRMVTDERAAHHCYSESVKFPSGESYNLANSITWGIEGYQLKDQDTQQSVVAAMVERVAFACRRFRLSPSEVLGHKEIDPRRRSDPVGVNMDEFRKRVQRRLWEMLENVPRRFHHFV